MRRPTGAFYVFANVRHVSMIPTRWPSISSKRPTWALPRDRLRRERRGLPGFSYASSMENIAEAMNRLEKYFARTGNVRVLQAQPREAGRPTKTT